MDLFETVLSAGIDVVTTADWITGHHRDRLHPHPSGKPARQVIEEACRRGGSTFYGAGMNPGLAQIVAIVASAGMARVDHVTVKETVDVSCHHSVGTWRNIGYGRPVDDPEVPRMLERGNGVFADAIHLIADCMGLAVDDVRFECELGACTEDVDLGWWRLARGSLGASLMRWKGLVAGEPRIEIHLEWQMTPRTDPRWDVENCYVTTLLGDPVIVNRHMIFPELDSGKGWDDPGYFAAIGMTLTGLPGLNAMPFVCAAPPGILTRADLPLRAFAGRLGRRDGRDRGRGPLAR
jgi:4-hydroxy-tetrahydrodipicolinate reductase